jgi:hypothetical protein
MARKTPKAKACKSDNQAEKDQKVIDSRSTDTDTQCRKVVLLLRSARKNTYELRAHGIAHPAGRIQTLRESGFEIRTDQVTAVDSDGFTHHGVALYTLLREPAPTGGAGG